MKLLKNLSQGSEALLFCYQLRNARLKNIKAFKLLTDYISYNRFKKVLKRNNFVIFIKNIMSRTIKTNSGTQFMTNINSEALIGTLCKEVGTKHDNDFIGPSMAYDMTEEEVNDAAYKLTILLESEKYYRLFQKVKPDYFGKDSSIYDFTSFIEKLIDNLKQSKGYTCL